MLKSVEMKQRLEVLNNKAKKLIDDPNAKLEDINAIGEEIESLQSKIAVQEKLEAEEKAVIQDKAPRATNDEVKRFINALRTKFRNEMVEGTGEDGGYLVPQDIQTRINELRESKDALQRFITVEPVATLSGSRVFKARSQQTGFSEVAEGGPIGEKATPKFTLLEYAVKKYAGFYAVTNELLKDSDQAIERTLIDWIGNESRVTRNKLILAELDKKEKTEISDPDDIKDILNVTLDPVFRYTSIILTNQDGFNWLDKLRDAEGNYLLQPSISSPTGKQLFGVDVVMVSNKNLPSDTTGDTKAPIIIGDLKEGVIMFDRETTEIMASNVAMDAFETDRTLFRVIEREQVKIRDDEAFVYGQITIE